MPARERIKPPALVAVATALAILASALLCALATPALARDPQDPLSRHSRAEPTRKWIGKPITIKTANVELADLFRLIADASGFNLILSDGIQGTIRAIDWQDVPWDQALDMILKTKHLKAEREGNMLRILTTEEFVREQQEITKAKAAAQENTRDSTSVQVIRR